MRPFASHWLLCTMLLILAVAPVATAQDRVYQVDGETISGKVEKTNKYGLTLKKSGKDQNILAGNIEKVIYGDEPKDLTQARQFALDGQTDQAIEELKKVSPDALKSPAVQAEFDFLVAKAKSEQALAGSGSRDDAIKSLIGFVGKNRDSWHFTEAARLLGDLALAKGDAAKAKQYYSQLSKKNLTTRTQQIQAMYLVSLAELQGGDASKALEGLDRIIGVESQSAQTTQIKRRAKATKAVALAKAGKANEGIELAKSLIADLDLADTRTNAEIYNSLGAAKAEAGDKLGAVIDYLHTHYMFSTNASAHAKALSELVTLYTELGKPSKAAAMRSELQQRYPGLQ